jgi:hypothetical protein
MDLDMSRFNKRLAPAALLAAVALGATACGGKSTCESMPSVSHEYSGGSQPNGIEVVTSLQSGAEQVDIGFTDPGGNWHDEWLPASQADKIAMSIGPGAVSFRIKIKALQGSEICGQKPDTKFIQKSYEEAVRQDRATVPDPSKFHLDEHR